MKTLEQVSRPHRAAAQNENVSWQPGVAPVAIIMISLNEGHNMGPVLENLRGWAQQVFLVDSYSQDDTVEIALRHGVHVVQRRFRGFADQWNFALRELPILAPWTMKLDPDERLSARLKAALQDALGRDNTDAMSVTRRLCFMGRGLAVKQRVLRVWRTGLCRFSDVAVNEHPIVTGRTIHLAAYLEHHDSPDLEHWLEKQNRYTTAEAIMAFRSEALAATPRCSGTKLERRMWLKKNFGRVPCRYSLLFLYHWIAQGAWRAGWPGYAWAKLRTDVMRIREYKYREMVLTGRVPAKRTYGAGEPDSRVQQFD